MNELISLNITLFDQTINVWLVLLALTLAAYLAARLLVGVVGFILRWPPPRSDNPRRGSRLRGPLLLLLTLSLVGLVAVNVFAVQGFTRAILGWLYIALMGGAVLWLLVRIYLIVTNQRLNGPGTLVFTRLLYVGYGQLAGFVVLIMVLQYPIRCVPDCVAANLRGTNLSELNLSASVFIEADMVNTNLFEANLRGSDFSGVRLNNANLQGADMRDALFIGADLRGVDLRNANLNGADFTGALLDGADLTDNDLTSVTLDGATLDNATLVRVNLSGADLAGASLLNATMTSIDLTGANLVGARLSGSSLSGSQLADADLSGALVNIADLSNSNLENISLQGTYLIGSRMASTNLQNSRLQGAILLGVNLGGADLTGANLTGIKMFPSEFLDQTVLRIDPVLGELNEIARNRVLSTVRISGVIFDDMTTWPPSKQALLLDRISTVGVERVEEADTETVSDTSQLIETAETIPVSASDGESQPPTLPPLDIDLTRLNGNINGEGSDLIIPLSQAIADDFQLRGFGGQIFLNGSTADTGDAFDLFCNRGAVDLVFATRFISEAERNACIEQGRQPIAVRIGTIGALAVVVSPLNTYIDNLTLQDLREALTAERWTDVNSNYPPLTIRRYLPDQGTEAFDVLVEQIMEGDANSLLNAPNTAFDRNDANLVWELLSGGPEGIAIIDFDYLRESETLVRGIRLEDAAPDRQGIEGMRYPLSRPVMLYVDQTTLQRQFYVTAFVNHYLTKAETIISDFGFAPLLPENYVREQTQFLLSVAGTR